MQNFATMLNTQNTVSFDDFLNTNQNQIQNYDTKNIVEKGKEFFNVLNGGKNNISNTSNTENVTTKKTNNKNTNVAQDNTQASQIFTTNQTVKNKTNPTNTPKPQQTNQQAAEQTITKDEQIIITDNSNKTLTIDEVKSEPVVKEAQETSNGENMQVLDANKVIQNTVNEINNLIETSLDGQLNSEDVEQLKNALEEIKEKINNNQLVVSEDTKQMLNGVLDRLLTQNPQDLELAELQKDLKQLAQDIEANTFKLNSQVKLEEENENGTKALETQIVKKEEVSTKETVNQVKVETTDENSTQQTTNKNNKVEKETTTQTTTETKVESTDENSTQQTTNKNNKVEKETTTQTTVDSTIEVDNEPKIQNKDSQNNTSENSNDGVKVQATTEFTGEETKQQTTNENNKTTTQTTVDSTIEVDNEPKIQNKDSQINTSENSNDGVKVQATTDTNSQEVSKIYNKILDAISDTVNNEEIKNIQKTITDLAKTISTTTNPEVVEKAATDLIKVIGAIDAQAMENIADDLVQVIKTQANPDSINKITTDIANIVNNTNTESLEKIVVDIKNALNQQTTTQQSTTNQQPTIDLTKLVNTTKEIETVEINSTETTTTTANNEKTTQKTENIQKNADTVSENKEVQNAQNKDTNDNQEILDEINLNIEETSQTSTNTNSQNQSYSTAQDEVAKLQIQNLDNDSANSQMVFTLDKTIKNINTINKPSQVDSLPKEFSANDILNQIGSKLEQLKDGQSTKLTMTLRPNDLGRVTIELLSSANGISTSIIAQNSQVKELLDKNIDILKQQLAQQGINVQNIQVKTVEQNSQAGLNNSYNERQNQQENQGQGQNSANKENNQNQNQQQKRPNFKFNRNNIIENIDFENNTQSATTSINTLRGKISYNL